MPVSVRLSSDARYGRKDAEAQDEARGTRDSDREVDPRRGPRENSWLARGGKLVASSPCAAIQSVCFILAGSIDFFVEIPSNTLGRSNELRGF
jgi:hypothetical protein